MGTEIDLTILDSGSASYAIATARCGGDMAIARLSCGNAFQNLGKFRARINAAVLGRDKRPSSNDLMTFGQALHSFIMQGDLNELYQIQKAADHVRIHLISNRADLQAIPWEYLQEPGFQPGPRRERSVARIVRTIGVPPPIPFRLPSQKVRVLFVSAEPQDQEPVSWPEMQESIERTFSSRLPGRLEMKAVEGADIASLTKAVMQNDFDIFHFSGHGEVVNGVGHLVLQDRKTMTSSRVSATTLGTLLGGKSARLAILSACDTATGNFATDFSVLAETLVQRGFPAVVANQLPLPDKSAAIFAEGLYGELLTSGDIDRATSEGRINLAVQLDDGASAVLEWGIPTLYRRMGAAILFQP